MARVGGQEAIEHPNRGAVWSLILTNVDLLPGFCGGLHLRDLTLSPAKTCRHHRFGNFHILSGVAEDFKVAVINFADPAAAKIQHRGSHWTILSQSRKNFQLIS